MFLKALSEIELSAYFAGFFESRSFMVRELNCGDEYIMQSKRVMKQVHKQD